MLVVFLLNEKQTRRNMGGELEPSEETKRNMKEKKYVVGWEGNNMDCVASSGNNTKSMKSI